MRFSTVATAVALAGLVACSAEPAAVSPDVAVSPNVSGSRADASRAERTPTTIGLRKIGGFAGGGPGAAEIVAYDEKSKRLFVVNGGAGTVDVLDLTDPANPTRISSLNVSAYGASANSVAATKGLVAVAVEAAPKTNPGTVVFYDATSLEILSTATVGALPDHVVFADEGELLLVANEGEPSADYSVDPEGSVSIIDIENVRQPRVRTADFTAYIGQEAALRAQGIRIFGPNANAAQDLEPEYIAVADDEDDVAYVTLQENNAVAKVDLETARVTALLPLGYKDHSLAKNKLDASDRDGPGGTRFINIRNYPVFGMYQPDGVAAYRVRGQTYFITANEGDARDPAGEEVRVATLAARLNPAIFGVGACDPVRPCSDNGLLGRLNVTRTLGLNPATNLYDALYAFGARSFSIWSSDGSQVFDSGDDLEQRTTSLAQVPFNASNDNDLLDDRSDNKGPEPEGVVVGRIGQKRFAFIGLERVGGVIVYDVTNPAAPVYVTYVNTRGPGLTGDRGPEGIAFVRAKDSPNKQPLLIVGNETSGTTAIFQIDLQ